MPQEGGLGGDCAPSYFTMHQGAGRGHRASPGLHAWHHPPRLAADPLSCHPPPLSLPRCVLSWMSRIQSCCTVPTGQRSPLCTGRGPSIPVPHPCRARAGPGWWVGAGWEALVVLACKLPWVFDVVSRGLHVPECNAPSFHFCLREAVSGYRAVHLGTSSSNPGRPVTRCEMGSSYHLVCPWQGW